MTSSREVWQLSRLALGEADGWVVVLKVYMDESGIHDDSPVVCVAAYLGRPREWQAWTKQWNAAKRPVKVFHATDAQNLKGEFDGWKSEDRDELVKRLIAVQTAFNHLPGIMIGINLDEFRAAIKGRALEEDLNWSPYAACFQWVVQTILLFQKRVGSSERIGFVHETNSFKHEALGAFSYAKEHNPANSIIGLQFGDKADYPPLQAADILAYEGNKRLRDPSRPERRPWTALSGNLIAAHYGRNNMHELISRMEMIRDGKEAEIPQTDGWVSFISGERAA